tara:strand:+ start:14668 stop:14904 length:237 start_codon:yes stop_codon:yes gene_type:complete
MLFLLKKRLTFYVFLMYSIYIVKRKELIMLKFIGAEFVGGRKLSVREQKMYRKQAIELAIGFFGFPLLCVLGIFLEGM